MVLLQTLPLCAVLLIAVQIPFSETRPPFYDIDNVINKINSIFRPHKPHRPHPRGIINDGVTCKSESCKNIAKMILQNMDKSVNPCDNFYNYTCGNFHKYHSIPSTESSINQFYQIQDRTDNRIRAILEEEISDNDIFPVKAAKQMYISCMDLDAIEEKGIIPIQMLLEQNGGWPLIMDTLEWDENGLSWQEISNNYASLSGEYPVFSIGIQSDIKNSSVNTLAVDQPVLPMFSFMLADPVQYTDQINIYAKFIENVTMVFAKAADSTVSREKIVSEIHNMINFEIEIAKIMTDDETRRDIERSYNKLTVKTLQEFYDAAGPRTAVAQINWLATIQNIFNEVKFKIDETETVMLLEKDYISGLVGILNRTPQRTIVNYVHWRLINKLMQYTTKELNDYSFQIGKELYGFKADKPRWEKCVTENQFVHGVSYQYVKKYFSEESKIVATNMVNTIIDEMRILILQSDWLDYDTKMSAKQKLDNMDMFIAYPDWYNDEQSMNDYYKEIKIGPVYFYNVLHIMVHELKNDLLNLRTPVDINNWSSPPTTVNAWYEPSTNTLTLPVAILQEPFFDATQLPVLNYGAIGAIISHEVSHGFDDVGRLFNQYHEVAPWWSDATIKLYDERAQCFIDQFNKYIIDDLTTANGTVHDNGELTEGENIADSTGLQTVSALFTNKMIEGDNRKMPGMEEFTNDQLLFIAYGNVWCEVQRLENLLNHAKTDEHSPPKVRLIGAISNTDGFSKAFQCAANSPMNPKKKCHIWG